MEQNFDFPPTDGSCKSARAASRMGNPLQSQHRQCGLFFPEISVLAATSVSHPDSRNTNSTHRLFQDTSSRFVWSLINWRNKKKKKHNFFDFLFSRHFIHLQTSSPKTLFIHESKQQVFCHDLFWKRADFLIKSPPSCISENVSSATSRNDFCVCMKNLCSSVISSDGFY